MPEGRKSPEMMTAAGGEKRRMLKHQQWVLEYAGDRWGFSPEEALEPLATLVRRQGDLERLLTEVEKLNGDSGEKKQKLISRLEELTTDLNNALAQLKELK